MSGKMEKACWADIHRDFLVATILSTDGSKLQNRFDTSLESLLKFKSWLKNNGCHKLAVESTGTYWISIFIVLYDLSILFLQMHIKSNIILAGKNGYTWFWMDCWGMLRIWSHPSRILPKEYSDLSSLTRARERLVKIRSALKNQVIRAWSCIYQLNLCYRCFWQKRQTYSRWDSQWWNIDKILDRHPFEQAKSRKWDRATYKEIYLRNRHFFSSL
jgi:hypothetical protein